MNCKYLISFFLIVASCLQQCCWGQSTTVRPYKFGFNIDQQQHRREMRDERGIVMGEFGFITADGIYHVTVYATDEQGRFRILAMKNYPYESPPKTVEVMVQPKIPPKTTITTTTAPKDLPRRNFNTQACAGCFLTNGDNKPKGSIATEEKTPKKATRPLTKSLSNPSASSETNSKNPIKPPSSAAQPKAQGSSASLPAAKTNTGNSPPIMDIIMQKVLPALIGKKEQLSQASGTTQSTTHNNNAAPSVSKPNSVLPKKTTGSSGPPSGDLYRFKYILGTHGHTESGKRNGNKEGSYFSIGDDDVERTIEYVANEFGYQPRVRWRKLNSNEIKTKQNTLKDYEFIWFSQ